MINIKKFIAEFIGTFILLLVILMTGKAIPIGITLAILILLLEKISSQFHPVVSGVFYIKGEINSSDLITCVVAQIIGGFCALIFYNYIKHNKNKTKI